MVHWLPLAQMTWCTWRGVVYTSLSSDKTTCQAAAASKTITLLAHLTVTPTVVQHAKDVNDLQQSSSQLS